MVCVSASCVWNIDCPCVTIELVNPPFLYSYRMCSVAAAVSNAAVVEKSLSCCVARIDSPRSEIGREGRPRQCMTSFSGQVPEWTKGADCKSAAIGFQGSNPCLPTIWERGRASQDYRKMRLQDRACEVAGSWSKA